MRFKVTQYIGDYVKVGDEYRRVEVPSAYNCGNYDDLQNLLLTLIDFGTSKTKFEVEKIEEVDD